MDQARLKGKKNNKLNGRNNGPALWSDRDGDVGIQGGRPFQLITIIGRRT